MSVPVDAFALLGLPRQASLDPDLLRQHFQERAAQWHPDHAADAADRAERTVAFAALSEAQGILASTPRRLHHLLGLLEGDPASRTAAVMDAGMMSLFSMVGKALAAAESVRRRLAEASTALARALLSPEAMAATETVAAATAAVASARAALEMSLGAIDAALWSDPPDHAPLRQACGTVGFLEKWDRQLRAAYAALAF